MEIPISIEMFRSEYLRSTMKLDNTLTGVFLVIVLKSLLQGLLATGPVFFDYKQSIYHHILHVIEVQPVYLLLSSSAIALCLWVQIFTSKIASNLSSIVNDMMENVRTLNTSWRLADK